MRTLYICVLLLLPASNVHAFGLEIGFEFGNHNGPCIGTEHLFGPKPPLQLFKKINDEVKLFSFEPHICYRPKYMPGNSHGLLISAKGSFNIISPPDSYFFLIQTGITIEAELNFRRSLSQMNIHTEISIIRIVLQIYRFSEGIILAGLLGVVANLEVQIHPDVQFTSIPWINPKAGIILHMHFD